MAPGCGVFRPAGWSKDMRVSLIKEALPQRRSAERSSPITDFGSPMRDSTVSTL